MIYSSSHQSKKISTMVSYELSENEQNDLKIKILISNLNNHQFFQ